jgi:hypothetical protein
MKEQSYEFLWFGFQRRATFWEDAISLFLENIGFQQGWGMCLTFKLQIEKKIGFVNKGEACASFFKHKPKNTYMYLIMMKMITSKYIIFVNKGEAHAST